MNQQVKQNYPFFPESAEDYLLLHGWEIGEGREFVGQYYFKGDEMIIVKGDSIQLLTHHDEEEGQRKAEYSVCHAFTGIADLDEFNWMLLFHITEAVPLKQFVKKAKQESGIHPLFEDILNKHFRIGQSHDSIPVNY